MSGFDEKEGSGKAFCRREGRSACACRADLVGVYFAGVYCMKTFL